MTVLEKIAKIRRVEVKNSLIEEDDLVVFTTTCRKIIVSVREIDTDGDYNWNTQIFDI